MESKISWSGKDLFEPDAILIKERDQGLARHPMRQQTYSLNRLDFSRFFHLFPSFGTFGLSLPDICHQQNGKPEQRRICPEILCAPKLRRMFHGL